MQRKLITIIIIFTFAGFLWLKENFSSKNNLSQTPEIQLSNNKTPAQNKSNNSSINDSNRIADAFKNNQSNIQVQAQGKIIKLLADDNKGSRHQKFLIQLNNNQSLLIAHNIDLAPRINNLKLGDFIEFYGEYEYNDQGGIIHWTHKDPQKKHPDGWLKYNGNIYQ